MSMYLESWSLAHKDRVGLLVAALQHRFDVDDLTVISAALDVVDPRWSAVEELAEAVGRARLASEPDYDDESEED